MQDHAQGEQSVKEHPEVLLARGGDPRFDRDGVKQACGQGGQVGKGVPSVGVLGVCGSEMPSREERAGAGHQKEGQSDAQGQFQEDSQGRKFCEFGEDSREEGQSGDEGRGDCP